MLRLGQGVHVLENLHVYGLVQVVMPHLKLTTPVVYIL